MTDLRDQMSNKLLAENERHFMEVKRQIAEVIAEQAKRAIISGFRPPESLGELKQEVADQTELTQRVNAMAGIIEDLGFSDEATLEEIRAQIKTWDEQEDIIDELRAELEELREEK